MARLILLLPLLACALCAQSPEPLPDPNDTEGWANAASKADILALPADTKHLHGHDLADSDLEALKRFKGLVSLTLNGEYTDGGLRHVAELKTLRNLQLDCDNLSDAALVHVGKLANLEWLGLERCHRISDKGLRELAGLKKVNWLILHGDQEGGLGGRGNSSVTDNGLKQLAGMTAMQRLDISYMLNAGDAPAELGPRMKDLQWLTLSYCGKVTEAGFNGLAKCNALKQVDLVGLKKLNAGCFKALAGLKALESVKLTMCDGADDTAVGALGKSKSLVDLSVMGRVAFGDAGLAELAKCKTLRSISLESVNGLMPEDFVDSDEEVDGVGEPGRLPPPKLPTPKPAPKIKLTDAGFKAIAKAGTLRELRISGMEAVTDVALLGLVDAPLEALALNACPNVTDKGLQVLGKMKALKRLSLSATGDGPPLPGAPKAGKMRITNEGLAHLAGLENLVELNLSGQAITDAGLAHLKGLVALRVLVLSGVPGVTPAGEAALREAIPELDIQRASMDGPPGD
ncbi:MAG: hypothetical protein KF754_08875 [Planctomycetes bacterium]|nr:hypothetical protein [Planctomycetota bacterium]